MTAEDGRGFSDNWPDWAKPAFALAGMVIWVGAPLVAAWSLAARTVQAGGAMDYQPILVVLVGMTTATITGIFVFMSFRIDRGTRFEAQKIAEKVVRESKIDLAIAKDNAIEAVNCALQKIIDESERKVTCKVRWSHFLRQPAKVYSTP